MQRLFTLPIPSNSQFNLVRIRWSTYFSNQSLVSKRNLQLQSLYHYRKQRPSPTATLQLAEHSGRNWLYSINIIPNSLFLFLLHSKSRTMQMNPSLHPTINKTRRIYLIHIQLTFTGNNIISTLKTISNSQTNTISICVMSMIQMQHNYSHTHTPSIPSLQLHSKRQHGSL